LTAIFFFVLIDSVSPSARQESFLVLVLWISTMSFCEAAVSVLSRFRLEGFPIEAERDEKADASSRDGRFVRSSSVANSAMALCSGGVICGVVSSIFFVFDGEPIFLYRRFLRRGEPDDLVDTSAGNEMELCWVEDFACVMVLFFKLVYPVSVKSKQGVSEMSSLLIPFLLL
jgi:hypothetical protein